MFQNLTERLSKTIRSLTGQGRLTEDNIKETLREVRIALLEADVALPVVKHFIDSIRERAIGTEVMQSLSPGQALVKIVNEELVKVLGAEQASLNFNTTPPAVILMAGLQGSGKTTSAAKLARWLKEQSKRSIMLVSTDIYRPAAIEQLKTLAAEVDVSWFPSDASQAPVAIAEAAIAAAKRQAIEVVIVDTAGRLHIDEMMMAEIKAIHRAVKPIETLFVIDCMAGQDAVNTAKAFSEALPLTGTILSKTDGDARGGVALSVRHITGQAIKFMGVGERTTALEVFYPDRMASRILGMGDVLSLIEEAERKLDRQEAERLAQKLKKGKGFDLEDFRNQLLQMNKLGGITGLLDKLPGAAALPDKVKSQLNDKQFSQVVAIIDSMTPKERRYPDIIKSSRKQRIAKGSGTEVQDVNRLLKQFMQMQKMMKKLSKGGGMMKMLRNMKGMLPPGMLG